MGGCGRPNSYGHVVIRAIYKSSGGEESIRNDKPRFDISNMILLFESQVSKDVDRTKSSTEGVERFLFLSS